MPCFIVYNKSAIFMNFTLGAVQIISIDINKKCITPEEKNYAATLFSTMTLQWFAAEDEGRTEEPTEERLKKAREEGRVARSNDLSSSIVLLAGIIILAILGRNMFSTMEEMLNYYLGFAANPEIQGAYAEAFINYFLRMLVPVILATFIAGILGNVIQVGFLFTTKPLNPDFKRIVPNFARYFKRVLFSTEALFNFTKSIVKIIIIIGIATANIAFRVGEVLTLMRSHFMGGVILISELAFLILIESAIAIFLFSFVDYWFQRRLHKESLKMTKREVIEERKNYEGDPLIKSRLRQRMREILQLNMIRNVPNADVVVTNPTHYAVALEYKRESMDAPMVIAKGKDHLAERIKNIARENDVPVMENKPLARILYAEVEIGHQVPVRHYQAVAELLKLVYRLGQTGVTGHV